MAQLALAEHLRAIEAGMRDWMRTSAGSSAHDHVMIDHWATRLAALAVMADKSK